MARTLPPRDVPPRRPPPPQDPRWTHPLARVIAIALGFDPDPGADLEIRTTR